MPEQQDQAVELLDEDARLDEDAPMESGAPEGLDDDAIERRQAALARVVKFGDPVLRSVASPVGDFDPALAGEVERMIEIMRDGMGVGLAATQLGILRRVLVFKVGADATPTAVVNPEIGWASTDLATAEEGCLSIPGVIVEVERPLHVLVGGSDPAGEPLSIEASGLEARVIQHEMDHLDGVLILQRTSREQRKGAMRALREGESYAPPGPDEEEEAEEAAGERAPEDAQQAASGA
jgi:peptide deformylase